MNTKIAQMHHVLTQAAEAIRKQASRINRLESELVKRDRQTGAAKLASSMHEKGLDTDVPYHQLAARLEKLAESDSEEYTRFRDAVDIIGPDMGVKAAAMSNNDERSSIGSSDFERLILGQFD